MILGPFFFLEYELFFRFQQRYPSIFYYNFLRRICFRLKNTVLYFCHYQLKDNANQFSYLHCIGEKDDSKVHLTKECVHSKNPPEYYLRR